MVDKFPYEERAKLDDRWRHEHLDPVHFWRLVGLRAGEHVVDVGAGIGYFALPAARLVGPGGHVYACDVSAEMVADLARRAHEAGYAQLEALRSQEHHLPLPDAVADLVLAAFVLHEVQDPYALLRELRRLLRPRGRLVVIDWAPDAAEPPDLPRRQRYAPATVQYMLRKTGFAPTVRKAPNEANYLVVSRRADAEGSPEP